MTLLAQCDLKGADTEVTLQIVKGVENLCVVLNGRRIVGPKPWGGGRVLHSFKIKLAEIKKALEQ
jgi:hypothetical protein